MRRNRVLAVERRELGRVGRQPLLFLGCLFEVLVRRGFGARLEGPEAGETLLGSSGGGDGGRGVTPPVGWLEDYWMGRYYGMITATTTTEPALVTVPPNHIKATGAAPYNGPRRPTQAVSE